MNVSTTIVSVRRSLALHMRKLMIALALMFGIATAGATIPALFAHGGNAVTAPSAQATPAVCDDGLPQTDEQPWIRTELFFGSAKPDGTAVTDAEWRDFLNKEITERFPDGLTVLSGVGQWQEADDTIVQETSRIVIILYPGEYAHDSGLKIEEIRAAYETQYHQESVLRADDSRPVCTSF